LVTAFRSTLEETSEADLLIHLVDSSDPHREEKMKDVADVIAEVGAQDVPQLVVFNKIDLLDPVVSTRVDRNQEAVPERVWISAQSGQGLDLLMDCVASFFKGLFYTVRLKIDVNAGKQRAELYQLGQILEETFDEQGNSVFKMQLTQKEWNAVKQWDELIDFEVLE